MHKCYLLCSRHTSTLTRVHHPLLNEPNGCTNAGYLLCLFQSTPSNPQCLASVAVALAISPGFLRQKRRHIRFVYVAILEQNKTLHTHTHKCTTTIREARRSVFRTPDIPYPGIIFKIVCFCLFSGCRSFVVPLYFISCGIFWIFIVSPCWLRGCYCCCCFFAVVHSVTDATVIIRQR